MKTVHNNFSGQADAIYCHRVNDLVRVNETLFAQCRKCGYQGDSLGGQGVQCIFDDKSNEEIVFFDDAADSERYSQLMWVRMGMMTELEVDSRLKGSGSEQTDIYADIDNADNLEVDDDSVNRIKIPEEVE